MASSGFDAALRRTGLYTIRTGQYLCAIYLVAQYVVDCRVTFGPSMFPTLGISNEVVFVSKIPYLLYPPRLKRGDLVISKSPFDASKDICKRVLGLPGDTVCTDPAGVWRPVDEHIVIPKGHVWLGGDNVRHSTDSRVYGPVPVALLKGKVLARLWPSPCIFRNPLTFIDA